jgi:CDP-glucose 4,6-dehydratase
MSRPGGAVDPAFWRGRRVLVTGHTGFKGSWLVLWLARMEAQVIGLAPGVPTSPSLYELADAGREVTEVPADVRDAAAVHGAVAEHRPEVVIHMAAQAFVRRSFAAPRETYEINVMGTVNVLEAVRASDTVRAVVVVTSDKCYDNDPARSPRPFVEDDCMGGHDPYSNSKGCAELVADAYSRSYFAPTADGLRLATARAGNVIGGGDWGEDRLIPDIMRGAVADAPIPIRNPEAVRPWQHVLNPLSGYLLLAQALWDSPEAQGGWNFGPSEDDVRPVRWIADRVTELWPGELRWEIAPGPHPHEARYLSLDSTKARSVLGWAPGWGLAQALESIVQWHAALRDGADLRTVSLDQLERFGREEVSP